MSYLLKVAELAYQKQAADNGPGDHQEPPVYDGPLPGPGNGGVENDATRGTMANRMAMSGALMSAAGNAVIGGAMAGPAGALAGAAGGAVGGALGGGALGYLVGPGKGLDKDAPAGEFARRAGKRSAIGYGALGAGLGAIGGGIVGGSAKGALGAVGGAAAGALGGGAIYGALGGLGGAAYGGLGQYIHNKMKKTASEIYQENLEKIAFAEQLFAEAEEAEKALLG